VTLGDSEVRDEGSCENDIDGGCDDCLGKSGVIVDESEEDDVNMGAVDESELQETVAESRAGVHERDADKDGAIAAEATVDLVVDTTVSEDTHGDAVDVTDTDAVSNADTEVVSDGSVESVSDVVTDAEVSTV
jgi:hypothetical protein